MRALPQKACCANVSPAVRFVSPSSSAGFSAIELLVMVAVLVVLVTLYFAYASSNQHEQKMKLCEQNLQRIHIAMEIYARDSAGRFPSIPAARTAEEALDILVPRYTADTSVFICPASKDASLPAGESFRQRKISYAYFMGRGLSDAQELLMSDSQINAFPKNAGQFAFSTTGKPPGNNHGSAGGNFLFCDGRVETTPAAISFPFSLAQRVVLLNPKP